MKILCTMFGHKFCHYDYDPIIKQRVEECFGALSRYSESSTEMIRTRLGHGGEREGGTVSIPWNILAQYINGVAGNGCCKRCGKEK